MRYLYDILEIFLGCRYTCYRGFWISCMSVSLFAYFLTKIRQRDISGSGWDIFLEFFGDIPEMLVHWFQIILIFSGDIPGMLVHLLQMILNFMYVCQSVCLLTSLPKLDKGISPVLDEISFWNFLETFLRCWYTGSK